MTEKRFVYDEIEDCIHDKVDLKTYWGVDDTLANKMNELNDENEQLKESNERFSKTVAEQMIMIKEYREENEELK